MNQPAPATAHPGPKKEFWGKFGPDAPASLEGLKVLEIGCGQGERALAMAAQGAEVTGIDLLQTHLDVGEKRKAEAAPEVAARVTFKCAKVQDLESAAFDIAISEDTFEHIMDVPEALADLKERLKIGGRAYIGFGPLYHSPYGDHGWMQERLPFGGLPWSHLYLPQKMTFSIMSKKLGKPVNDTHNWPFLALNQLTVSDFKRLFAESGMRIAAFHRTKHKSLSGKILETLAPLPVIGKYCTDGIYCVLERVD